MRRSLAIALLVALGLSTVMIRPGVARLAASPVGVTNLQAQVEPIEQGRSLFEAGRYEEAIPILQEAARQYQFQQNPIREAIALSNLSLTYQQLGRLVEANEAIATALFVLDETEATPTSQRIQAQAFTIQGQLYWLRGQLESAYDAWETAAEQYDALDDEQGVLQSRVNQAQALQDLGFYRRAVDVLEAQEVADGERSLIQSRALRSLGDARRLAGNWEGMFEPLLASLEQATQLNNADAIAQANLSLANAQQANAQRGQQLGFREDYVNAEFDQAFYYYEQAYSVAVSDALQTQIAVNHIRLLVDRQRWAEAENLWQTVRSPIQSLPATRQTVYDQVKLATALMQLRQGAIANSVSISSPSWADIADLLALANENSTYLDDRTRAYVIGTLGELYEYTQQWSESEQLTQQALTLSQRLNADDITYRLQWQLARLRKQQGDRAGAIAAYDEAIATLQMLRTDVVSVDNPDAWLSFRESIEPVHREFVDLLLAPSANPSAAELEKARQVIESLQLAELDNYFKEACLEGNPVDVDSIDPTAAVIYPIVLSDRIEIILNLPGQPLTRRTVSVDQSTVGQTIDEMRFRLIQDIAGIRVRRLGQDFYNWLIQPIAADLEASPTETLVFVLEGGLRNIPMAVLYDGQQYLIERYSVAIAPGLQLVQSEISGLQDAQILLAGVSVVPEDSAFSNVFADLPNVELELESIQNQFPSRVLLNQSFTPDAFGNALDRDAAPIIHLATHGKFSSNLDDTFLLAWNDTIDLLRLRDLLEVTDVRRRVPVELLVLSACETAQGDDRAALGLAGVAVQAGARSTIGTLWQVNDTSTSILMQAFYQQLVQPDITKAEALRQAQLTLIQDPELNSPFYWGAFVLVGNWL
jgi:CHAT domain-containing protein